MVGRSAHFFRWLWAGEPQNSDLWMSIPARSYKTRGVDFLSDDCCWSVSWADKFPDFQTLTKPVDKQWHHARSFLFLNSFHEKSKRPKRSGCFQEPVEPPASSGAGDIGQVGHGRLPVVFSHKGMIIPLLMGIPIFGDWGIPWCDHIFSNLRFPRWVRPGFWLVKTC